MSESAKLKKRGRPRKHESTAERVRSYRKRKYLDGQQRLDVYVSSRGGWRLTKLAKAWECSSALVVERLLLEADDRYRDILFPETD